MSPSDERVQINVHDIPSAIRAAVVDDARDRNVSITDVIGFVISECFSLPWSSSGSKFRAPSNDNADWIIRVPPSHRDALRERREHNSMSRLVLLCLADHYGLPAQSPRNRSLAQPRGEGGRFIPRR